MESEAPHAESDAPHIGSLNEQSLHAALKAWYARPDDHLEVPVDGYVVDIVRGELLIEVQTSNFAAIKRKLHDLVERHPVRVVYPIAQEKWLLKRPKSGRGRPQRRKSPKRGAYEHLFAELVRIPHLLTHPRFALEVLLIREEEVRRYDGRRRWRRGGWVTEERRLLEVLEGRRFDTPADLVELLPAGLTEPFTTADLAAAIGQRRSLAQKMAYCLRKMGLIAEVGREGRAVLYRREEIR